MTLQSLDSAVSGKSETLGVVQGNIKRKRFHREVFTPTKLTEAEEIVQALMLLSRDIGGGSGGGGGGSSTVVTCPPTKSFKCSVCEKTFPTHQALGGHKASHCRKPSTPMEKDLSQNPKIKTHECSVCGKSFSKGQALGGHRARHCKKPSTPSIKDLPQNPNKKTHECCVCGKSFSKGQALGGHMRHHSSETKDSQTSGPKPSVNSTVAAATSEGTSRPLDFDLNLHPPSEEGQDIHLEMTWNIDGSGKRVNNKEPNQKKPRVSVTFSLDF